jgi:hypothetical protein
MRIDLYSACCWRRPRMGDEVEPVKGHGRRDFEIMEQIVKTWNTNL